MSASPQKKVAVKAKTSDELQAAVNECLSWLKQESSEQVRVGMKRYGIPNDHALGVPVGVIRKLGKACGLDQALSLALWQTGVYEARLLACFVGEPRKVTSAQMDAWCDDFDNWAVCDTACFHLFDQTAAPFDKVREWSQRTGEFQKRAAFALLASIPNASDEDYLSCLVLIEREAVDSRNFVKKSVNWALRSLGNRSRVTHTECTRVAQQLAASSNATARWVGRDAVKQLASAPTLKRVERRG